MSFDIDEKEFYETFAEITGDRGLEEAKGWVWSALNWTQQELRSKSDKEDKERAAVLRLEQEVENLKAHRELCTENLLKGYKTGKSEERAAVVAHLRERAIHGAGNTITVEDACTILADLFERGEHRQEGGV